MQDGKKIQTESEVSDSTDDESASQVHEVTLVAKPSIESAGQLMDELEAVLEQSDAVRINASSVTSVDTAILQVLVSFVNAIVIAKKTIEWTVDTGELGHVAALIGLEDALQLTAVAPMSDEDDLCPVF